MRDKLLAAVAEYERAEGGFIPAGDGDLGRLFDAIEEDDPAAIRAAFADLTAADEQDPVLGKVIRAARSYVDRPIR